MALLVTAALAVSTMIVARHARGTDTGRGGVVPSSQAADVIAGARQADLAGSADWSWQNPNLAANPYNNIHNDSWFTDTYPAAGPIEVTGAEVRLLEKYIFDDPVTGDVRFLVLGECPAHTYDTAGNLVTVCAGLPNPVTNQFERSIVTIDPSGKLLAFAPFTVPFDNFQQAITEFGGIGYFYLDNEDRVVMGMPDGHIVTWDALPSDVSDVDAYTPVRDVNITGRGGAVPPDRGDLYALVPGETGYTWFTTSGGVMGTIAPDCTSDCVKWLDVNDPDGDGTFDPQPDGRLQKFSESHSVDENSTFQQSDYFMYRFDLGPAGAPVIAWQAPYDRGVRKKPGQTSHGSGTSPTYFELGGREYVTIFDNAITPHINVYRAETEIGRREERLVASKAPFGARREVSDENSLIVYPGSRPNTMRIFAENNWGNDSLLATAGPATTEPGFGGIELHRNGRARVLSPNETISVPSVVSKASIGANAVYTYEKRERGWHLTALDPGDLDRELWSVRVGGGAPRYNSWYSQMSLAPDLETFYVGVPQGLLRITTFDGPPPPPDACSSVVGSQDVVTMIRDLGEWETGPIFGPDYVEAAMVNSHVDLDQLSASLPDDAAHLSGQLDQLSSDLADVESRLATVDFDVTRLTPQQKEALREFANRHAAVIVGLVLYWAVRCTEIQLDPGFAANARILLYRSYLPTGGFDAVPLPDVTLVKNGVETSLPQCRITGSNDAMERFHTDQTLGIVDAMSAHADASAISPNDAPAPWCSWWGVSSVDTLNIAAPDENAAYWYMPLIADDETEVYIDGVFQDSRYMSLALYSATANPYVYNDLSSTIPDYLIEPEPGSQNPWQVEAPSGGRYRITIEPDPTNGEANVLPWYTTDPDSVKPTMPSPCGDEGSTNVACPLSNMFMSPPASDQTGIFSNVDNRYLMNLYDPDSVFVLRGRLPTTPLGTHPTPWPDSKYDLRYFSICDIVYVRPYPAVVDDGCAVDDEIPVDGDGIYTIVFSTEENRPDNATLDNGIVWIRSFPEVRNFLVMRHMLPSDEFAQAAQNVPQDASWVSALTTMGDYYPTTTITCNKHAFEVSPTKCWVPPPPGEDPVFVADATVSS